HQIFIVSLATLAVAGVLEACGKTALPTHPEMGQSWPTPLSASPLPGHQQGGFLMLAEKRRVYVGQIGFNLLVDRLPRLHPRQPGRTVTLPALHEWQANLLLILSRL